MTDAAERMLPGLLALPEAEHEELAYLLLESLETPASEQEKREFEEELDRRAEEFRSGKEPGISSEELFAELDAMLAARRR